MSNPARLSALALVCLLHAPAVLAFGFGVSPALRPALRSSSTIPAPALRTPLALGSTRSRLAFSPAGSLKMSGGAELEDDEQQEVVVHDLESGKSVECYVDQRLTLDGNDYALVYPCDRPVVLAFVDGDGDAEEMAPVPEGDIERVFPAAYRACAEQEVELVNSAVVLTLQGDLEDDLDAELEEYGEAGEDEEYVKVITSFTDAGIEYLVTEPLEPVLIVAKAALLPDHIPRAGGDGDTRQRFVCLPESEVDSVMPQVEAMLEKRFELEAKQTD